MTTPPMTQSRAEQRHRIGPIDGLKGVSILLVVLFHWDIVWSRLDTTATIGSFDFLFSAGNVAVTIFFAISGYLVTDRLLAAAARRRILGPLVYLEHRTLRILAQVGILLVALVVVWRADPTDTASTAATERSVWAAATFTFNRFVARDPLGARSDIGPLYFLSIDLQYFIAATVLIIILAKRRRLLASVVLITFAVVCWWRWHLFIDRGWFQAALATSARSDGLLAGSFFAVLRAGRTIPAPLARQMPAIAGASALVLFGAIVSCTYLGIDAYFGAQGIVAAVAAAVCAWALTDTDHGPRLTTQVLSWAPLAILGRASLTVFLWHMPILHAVRRHFGESSPATQSVLAILLLVMLTVLIERYFVPTTERGLTWLFSRRALMKAAGRM